MDNGVLVCYTIQMKKMEPAKLATLLKVLNVSAGIVIMVFGGICVFLTLKTITSGNFFLIAAPIFMILMGFLNVLVEFNVKWVTKHFNFLGSLVGRGVYNIFLGCMLYSLLQYASGTLVAWICCATLTVVGVIYICMQCCLSKEYKETYLNERLI